MTRDSREKTSQIKLFSIRLKPGLFQSRANALKFPIFGLALLLEFLIEMGASGTHINQAGLRLSDFYHELELDGRVF